MNTNDKNIADNVADNIGTGAIEQVASVPTVQNTESPIAIGQNERSYFIDKLATALSKAQSDMEMAAKDTKNEFFKSSYADLAAVIKASKKPLADNGLSITQLMVPNSQKVVVTTILMHTSGQYITSTIALNPVKSDPQGYGSAVTYARRYSYQSIIGLSADDDDGNLAGGHTEKDVKKAATDNGPITAEQKKMIRRLLVEKGKKLDDLISFTTKAFKVKPEDVNYGQAEGVIKKLRSLPDVEEAQEPKKAEVKTEIPEEAGPTKAEGTETLSDKELSEIPV